MTGPSHKVVAKLQWILTLGFLAVGNIAAALPSSHSPFFPGEAVAQPLNICNPTARKIVKMHPALGEVLFTAPDGRTLRLSVTTLADPYTETYEAQVTLRGRSLSPVVQVPLVATTAFLLPTKAICQDLNGDGKTDFITDHSRHGNGLGASFFDRLVILSSSDGYRFWELRTMDPSPEDYAMLGSDGAHVMVTTSFANSGGERPHSYYVYDLWQFADGRVVSANHLDSRFPKWVRMTLSDNHEPATSLTKDEKRKLLSPRHAAEIHGDAVR